MAGRAFGHVLLDVGARWMDTQHDVYDFRAAQDGLVDLCQVEPGLDWQQQIVRFGIGAGRGTFGFDRAGNLGDVRTGWQFDPDAVALGEGQARTPSVSTTPCATCMQIAF